MLSAVPTAFVEGIDLDCSSMSISEQFTLKYDVLHRAISNLQDSFEDEAIEQVY